MAEQNLPWVYILTPLTRIGAKRRTVMIGFDMERRTLVLLLIGFVMSLPLIAISWFLLKFVSLVWIPACWAVVFYAFSKTGSGLKQTQLRTRLDRMNSMSGSFILCGRVIEPLTVKKGRLVMATMPAKSPRPDPTSFTS